MDQAAAPYLYWDFFGPRAEQTSTHFLSHLREFLERHAISAPCGLSSAGTGHHAVYCLPPAEARDGVIRSLRPQRLGGGPGQSSG